jgi:hypothetical protein
MPPPVKPAADQARGAKTDRFDHNEAARKRHAAAERELYGDDGHLKTETLRQENDKASRARAHGAAKAKGETVKDGALAPDIKKSAERQYEATKRELCGDDSPEKTHRQRQANEEVAREREREAARARGESVPTREEELRAARGVKETSEKHNEQTRRRLEDEKWVERPDVEDLDPDRQREAPGGGRARSR